MIILPLPTATCAPASENAAPSALANSSGSPGISGIIEICTQGETMRRIDSFCAFVICLGPLWAIPFSTLDPRLVSATYVACDMSGGLFLFQDHKYAHSQVAKTAVGILQECATQCFEP